MGGMISRPDDGDDDDATDLESVIKSALYNIDRTSGHHGVQLQNAQASQADRPSAATVSVKAKITGENNFFKNIGAVATLGAGLSFSLIVSDINDPHEISHKSKFDLSTVRIILAATWLLFMSALALSFSLPQTWQSRSRRVKLLLWKSLYLLDIAAVICLSLVIAAYVEIVGYVGIALASLYAIVVIISHN
ncbi:hypothetical protein V502_01147 [Pseudogymnoascus sp. VKM F-4520 (FW-2644)]|nr:hypothetical protein V502_01147 [Pseudogymnoascus sp. VKM F-4520 (FW-2644)]